MHYANECSIFLGTSVNKVQVSKNKLFMIFRRKISILIDPASDTKKCEF